MRHQAITNRDFCEELMPKLFQLGYFKVLNSFIASEDYLIIDTHSKRFAWFQAEYKPYPTELEMYDDKTLTDLIEVQREDVVISQYHDDVNYPDGYPY